MDCAHEWKPHECGHYWECAKCRYSVNNDDLNDMLAARAERWRQDELARSQIPQCGNCAHEHQHTCHRHAPGPKGWPFVDHYDKCGDFTVRGSDGT